jgi:hypothetical protein
MARSGSSSGGIGGSGVFGLIGTTVQCDAENKGPYCTIAKIVNVFIWIMLILFVGKFALDFMRKR